MLASVFMIVDVTMHTVFWSSIIHGFVSIDARTSGSTSFGLIMSTATAAENAACVG